MTVVVAPYGSPEVRGRVASDVYYLRRGRQHRKTYVYLNPAPTSAQTTSRTRMRDLIATWQLLPSSYRASWIDPANSLNTAFTRFLSSGLSRKSAGLDELQIWRPITNPYSLHSLSLVSDAPAVAFSAVWHPALLSEELTLQFFVHGPLTAAQTPDPRHRALILNHIATTDGGLLALDPAAHWGIWTRFIFSPSPDPGAWTYTDYNP